MLRGCKQQVIVLRGTGSEIFDKAVFFIKNECSETKCGGTAMLLEANKIIEANRFSGHNETQGLACRDSRRNVAFFALGLLTGAVIMLLAIVLS